MGHNFQVKARTSVAERITAKCGRGKAMEMAHDEAPQVHLRTLRTGKCNLKNARDDLWSIPARAGERLATGPEHPSRWSISAHADETRT